MLTAIISVDNDNFSLFYTILQCTFKIFATLPISMLLIEALHPRGSFKLRLIHVAAFILVWGQTMQLAATTLA